MRKALKILLSPEDLISSSTSRDDLVALVNVLWKMSESLEAERNRMTLKRFEGFPWPFRGVFGSDRRTCGC